MAVDPSIAVLNLSAVAQAAAVQLLEAHPGVAFTSGRRGVNSQAHAMASNIAHNRHWIVQTYVDTPESRTLQGWVDAHPAVTDMGEVADGLASLMNGWEDAQRAHVSKHFSGDAFDVQPVAGEAGEAIKATIRALPGLTKFLTVEGGLIRWHAQFA